MPKSLKNDKVYQLTITFNLSSSSVPIGMTGGPLCFTIIII